MISTQPFGVRVYSSVRGAGFFERLVAEWQAKGVSVEVVSALNEHDYRTARSSLQRLALRWKMYPAFAWTCLRSRQRLESGKFQIATTNPFFVPALLARRRGRRSSVINLLFDLYPDALILGGALKRGTWLERRIAASTTFALRECAATVFLGDRLRQYVESTYAPAKFASVIPVGADGRAFRQDEPRHRALGRKARLLYCGQLGRMHDTATLSTVLGHSEATLVEWVFHSSGAGYQALRKSHLQHPNVEWGGNLTDLEWSEQMKRADVAVVTIAPGGENVVMPSKTYSALVAGQAVLAICPERSDLADLVRRHNCGWIVEPGDSAELKRVLRQISQTPEEVFWRRQRAFEAGHRCYDMAPIADLWLKLFSALPLAVDPSRADPGSPSSVNSVSVR